MKLVIILTVLLCSAFNYGQTLVTGVVTDNKTQPVMGANVFIEGTYDGAITDEKGFFSFTTTVQGKQKLVVSYVSYQTYRWEGEVDRMDGLSIVLKEDVNALDAVVISAGSIEAGDKARVSVLSSLDIVTTAGSMGDIVSALQSLPGTQTVGEDGRLFIRGGDASETQTYIDGVLVAQPYGASVQEMPTRGRFSPFLFDGISFSTGGYSAEFGNALSGVLLLDTKSEIAQNQTDISIMTVGAGVGHSQKWKNTSLSLNTAYINLTPYQALIPENITWHKPFESLAGEASLKSNLKNGQFKLYTSFDSSNFSFQQPTIHQPEGFRVDLKNRNYYLNSSYKGILSNNWTIHTGIGYGYATGDIFYEPYTVDNDEHTLHGKLKFGMRLSTTFKLTAGVDYFFKTIDENILDSENHHFNIGYNNHGGAAFSEWDIFVSKNFAIKAGLRASYNSYLENFTLNERLSMAYKFSKNSQVSTAYGRFTQLPEDNYLKYTSDLGEVTATHYILNYQYSKNRRFLRAEIYYKDYKDLVKYDTDLVQFHTAFSNAGSGYAQGLDIFFRDGKTFKNTEYWLSYSYIDSERDYRNFPVSATPNFIAQHTASVVGKYWINDWKSQLGLSYNFNSGRPYHNPNQAGFMAGKTKTYNSMNFSWAYLISQQKILFISVSNVLGANNVFGYEYTDTPDASGTYARRAITPTADRFFFIGYFWTISNDKTSNQLDNL